VCGSARCCQEGVTPCILYNMDDKTNVIKTGDKQRKSLEKVHAYFKSNEILPFNVGDILINKRSTYYKVLSLKPGRSWKWKEHPKKEYFDDVKVKLQCVDVDGNPSAQYDHEDGSPDDPFEEYLSKMKEYIVLQVSPSELEKEALQTILTPEKESEDQELSDSTALMSMNDKSYLETVKASIQKRSAHLEAKSRVLHELMETKRQELYGIMRVFEKQIKKIRRVIHTIELYLGIEEDVVQIQEGASAPIEEPIHIRQQILFMDEEVGNPDDLKGGKDGWDFTNIKDFERWLVTDNNYDKLLPEQKGVVVLRIRRYDKEYSDNFWVNMSMNENNHNTFFLIRNGDNIYCIWADLRVGARFFPLRNELQSIIDTMQKDEHMFDSDKEKIEDQLYFYRRNFILIQGLIERTMIFQPLAFEGFNVLKPESYGDYVKFIYDDEAALPTGRLSYKDWKKKLNKGIKRGSRIYVGRSAPGTGGSGGYESSSRESDRLVTQNYVTTAYDAPLPGLYTVEEGKEEVTVAVYDCYYDGIGFDEIPKGVDKKFKVEMTEDEWHDYHDGDNPNKYPEGLTAHHNHKKDKHNVLSTYLYIKYNPGGTIYGGWGDFDPHERKNKISYKIYDHDDFVFNYDVLPFDDIEFYLESRADRHNYVDMMPTLWDLQKLRTEEMEWENHFAELTKNELLKSLWRRDAGDKYEADMLICIWEAITWWKHKNIWQRPIAKDDAKALRMIKGRVLTAFRYLKER